MYTIVCTLATVGAILSAISFLVTLSRPESIQLLVGLGGLILYWSVWLLGQRFKSIFVQLIAAQYLILQLLSAIASLSEASSAGMIGRFASQYCMYTLLLAPSMSYASFYLAVFSLNIAQALLRTEEKAERTTLITIAVISVAFVSTFYYIYQKRELKRFFQQQDCIRKEAKAVNKQRQVTSVLDLQQNAILIASTD